MSSESWYDSESWYAPLGEKKKEPEQTKPKKKKIKSG